MSCNGSSHQQVALSNPEDTKLDITQEFANVSDKQQPASVLCDDDYYQETDVK